MNNLSITFLLVIPGIVFAGSGNRWTYEGELGPEHWPVDYEHCGGENQSPIDIEPSEVRLSNIPHFNTESYSRVDGVCQKLENVGGHTAEIIYTGDRPLTISGGGLPGEYRVDQFHFHWGAEDSRGSEHSVGGGHFPMEMHIVHHSTKYSCIHEAQSQPEGLAVLAFFFMVGKANPAFDELLAHFDQIEHAGDEVHLDTPIKLSSLLSDMSVFWRYHGSLTTPPCYESVIWTIFYQPIIISEEQLNIFRDLKRNREGDPERPLVDDFRPVQPLNDRVVETNHIFGTFPPVFEKIPYITKWWKLWK